MSSEISTQKDLTLTNSQIKELVDFKQAQREEREQFGQIGEHIATLMTPDEIKELREKLKVSNEKSKALFLEKLKYDLGKEAFDELMNDK